MGPLGGTTPDEEDDFALEVTDLRTGEARDQTPDRRHAAAAASAATSIETAGGDEDELRVTSLDGSALSALRLPRGLMSPRVRGITVVGFALTVLVAILINLTDIRQGIGEVYTRATPTHTAPLPVGGNVVYFVETVPWGALTADDNPIVLADVSSPTVLPNGRHALQYVAPPFATVRCQLSVPADPHDTCPLTANYGFGGDMGAARVVDFALTPERLPSGQYAALTRQVAIALEGDVQQTTLQPGDHYLGARGVAQAATRLHATATLQLNIDPSRTVPGYSGRSAGCVSLCAGYDESDVWTFEAHIMVTWHFAAQDGSISPVSGEATHTSVGLAATWTDGAWQLETQNLQRNGLGNLCWDAFSDDVDTTLLTSHSNSIYGNSAPAPNLADGCADVVSSSDDVTIGPGAPAATPLTLPADAALFVYRFGVVLAGNALAQKADPQLPVATARESALALQWLTAPSA